MPDAESELHHRRASLAVADNLLNRLALALACLKHGRHDESVELFESLDAGECHDDPLILLGLARSQFGLERFQAARQSLDRLIATNPEFRSEAGHLLYARTLEALGEVRDALHEYETLTSYSASRRPIAATPCFSPAWDAPAKRRPCTWPYYGLSSGRHGTMRGSITNGLPWRNGKSPPSPPRGRGLDRCAEIHYTFGGFSRPLFVYTPTLSLPLFKGAGTPPQGK